MTSPLTITQSLIKKFLGHGEEIPLCPKNIFYTEIEPEVEVPPTLPMLHGSYFETLAIGSGVDGKKITDLPRKKLTAKQERENRMRAEKGEELITGTKTIAQIRIEEQAERFNMLRVKHQVMVTEYNTQIRINKLWSNDVILSGGLDIFPTPVLGKEGYQLAMIDLKLTGDINNEFGEFSWGAPERMDHIQAQMYHYLVREIDFKTNKGLEEIVAPGIQRMIEEDNILFLYWVFSYGSADLKDKFVRYDWDTTKEAELKESIRKTVALIEQYEQQEWPADPEYERCAVCPLTDCTKRCTIQTI